MGHQLPDMTETERDDMQRSGALLVYLGLRDIHSLRTAITSRGKGAPPEVDP